jgi:hypothetical protein
MNLHVPRMISEMLASFSLWNWYIRFILRRLEEVKYSNLMTKSSCDSSSADMAIARYFQHVLQLVVDFASCEFSKACLYSLCFCFEFLSLSIY